MTILNAEQKKANERFFTSVINSLNEGGVYGYPAAQASYRKKGNRLVTNHHGLQSISHLVTCEFFEKNFGLDQ